MANVSVIGCGALGVKIAGELALHGNTVRVYDSVQAKLDTACQRVDEDRKELRAKGLIAANMPSTGRIKLCESLHQAVTDADFVFESILEELETKRHLFLRISNLCQPGTVIATNTLNLDVSEVTQLAVHRERTLGLRFLYPVYYIPEVEVTTTEHTSKSAVDKVRTLLEAMDKTLFFRSGKTPLILTNGQKEMRLNAHIEQICRRNMQQSSGHKPAQPVFLFHGHGPQVPDDHIEKPSGNTAVTDTSTDECAVCMDGEKDCVLVECQHRVVCHACAEKLRFRREGCPVCREPIVNIFKFFNS